MYIPALDFARGSKESERRPDHLFLLSTLLLLLLLLLLPLPLPPQLLTMDGSDASVTQMW